MFQTFNLSEAVLVSMKTGISPAISIWPFSYSKNCKICFLFSGLPENYKLPDEPTYTLSFTRLLLDKFEDYSRLQRSVQQVYKQEDMK